MENSGDLVTPAGSYIGALPICDLGRYWADKTLERGRDKIRQQGCLFLSGETRDRPAPIRYCSEDDWLHTEGVEFMKRLVEIRNQEFLCRERAVRDFERKIFWLARAEEWGQCALDEIAFYFRECNLDMSASQQPSTNADARILLAAAFHAIREPFSCLALHVPTRDLWRILRPNERRRERASVVVPVW